MKSKNGFPASPFFATNMICVESNRISFYLQISFLFNQIFVLNIFHALSHHERMLYGLIQADMKTLNLGKSCSLVGFPPKILSQLSTLPAHISPILKYFGLGSSREYISDFFDSLLKYFGIYGLHCIA